MIATPQRTKFWQRQTVRRLPSALERRTHIAIADLLRYTARAGWWWSHIPSGEYRTPETGALLKRMGLKPGMLDFMFISPTGRMFWLELKRGFGAPISEAQQAFCLELRRRNIAFFVARSYDDAVVQLREWGVL
jgi:hypothetical protein